MPTRWRLRARFETVYLTGWSPHESQQQPLKPGSAKTRLAEALGTAEHALMGDRALKAAADGRKKPESSVPMR